jgi:hypothetical protein
VASDLFAIYRGDRFIDVSTREELAGRHKVKPNTIYYMSTPAHKKRHDYSTSLFAYRIDDERANHV